MVSREEFLQKHRIFVEGTADQVFIRDILKMFYNISLGENELKLTVINVWGKDKLPGLINNFKEINTAQRAGGKI